MLLTKGDANCFHSIVLCSVYDQSTPATANVEQPFARMQAQSMARSGKLDEQAILDALRRNAPVAAKTMLAVRARVPLSAVEKACGMRSAKAIVSLAWKAGLTPGTAMMLQAALARVPPAEILRGGAGSGYALPEDEMRWQLSFLGVEKAAEPAATA